jgi:hypothetical protein
MKEEEAGSRRSRYSDLDKKYNILVHLVNTFSKHYTGKCRLELFVVLYLQVGN